MSDFELFMSVLRTYGDIEVSEDVQDETYTVTLMCGGKLLFKHSIIKCTCETADDIRLWVYNSTVEALFEKGLEYISGICGEKKIDIP